MLLCFKEVKGVDFNGGRGLELINVLLFDCSLARLEGGLEKVHDSFSFLFTHFSVHVRGPCIVHNSWLNCS